MPRSAGDFYVVGLLGDPNLANRGLYLRIELGFRRRRRHANRRTIILAKCNDNRLEWRTNVNGNDYAAHSQTLR